MVLLDDKDLDRKSEKTVPENLFKVKVKKNPKIKDCVDDNTELKVSKIYYFFYFFLIQLLKFYTLFYRKIINNKYEKK